MQVVRCGAVAATLLFVGVPDAGSSDLTHEHYSCEDSADNAERRYLQHIDGQLQGWLERISTSPQGEKLCVEQTHTHFKQLTLEEASALLSKSSDAIDKVVSAPGSYHSISGVLTSHFDDNDTIACGAILIDPSTVLTAAECVFDPQMGGFVPSAEFYPSSSLPRAPRGEGDEAAIPVASGQISSPIELVAFLNDAELNFQISVARLERPVPGAEAFLPMLVEAPVSSHCCQTVGYMLNGNGTMTKSNAIVSRPFDVRNRFDESVRTGEFGPVLRGTSILDSPGGPQRRAIVGVVASENGGALISKRAEQYITGRFTGARVSYRNSRSQ